MTTIIVRVTLGIALNDAETEMMSICVTVNQWNPNNISQVDMAVIEIFKYEEARDGMGEMIIVIAP
jgi:hypothetical protein